MWLSHDVIMDSPLFFEIKVNSGRTFTKLQHGKVNIMPLFTEIEKNNCFSVYKQSDLNNQRKGNH